MMLSREPGRRGSMDSVLGRAFFAGGASVTAAKIQVLLHCTSKLEQVTSWLFRARFAVRNIVWRSVHFETCRRTQSRLN